LKPGRSSIALQGHEVPRTGLITGKNRDRPAISTAKAAGDATVTVFGTHLAFGGSRPTPTGGVERSSK
jgi:hypothetical protein